MGKTISRKSNKFAAYDFDEEEQQTEQKSQELLKKFNPKNPKNSNGDQSPIDKYLFLQVFSNNMDHCKDNRHDPVDVDAKEERVEGYPSRVEASALSSSSNDTSDCHLCSNDCDARHFHSGENSNVVRGTKIGVVPGSSNFRENALQHFVSDNGLIGITSDDENDEIESSSSLTSKSYHSESEDLLEEQVLACGVDENRDSSVTVKLDHILYDKKFFLNSRLTFSSNCIKLEGSRSDDKKDSFSFEWKVADIVSIESGWTRNLLTALTIHLNTKDTKVTIDSTSPDILKLNLAISHPNWPKIEGDIKALDVRYEDAWSTDFHSDASNKDDVLTGMFSKHLLSDLDEPFEEVIYPKGDYDAVTISKRDVQLLQPETFINDTIIDFYMKYIKNKLKREALHRFHFFNSFFFRKLADLDKDPSRAHEGNVAFERVRKWTRKVNLFEKDYIFIPVNFRSHWSLIVVCHPGEVVKHKDQEMDTLLKVPCILHMDSIKGSHRGLKNLFQRYLLEEWKERHKESTEDISSRFLSLRFFDLELPQQENSFDCGLFLLHYAELFTRNAPANFNPYSISQSANFLRKDWFVPEEASLKRAHIKELIYKIARDNSQKVSASDEIDDSEYSGVDESSNSAECSHGTCNLADNCHDSYSSTASVELDTTPVAANPLRSRPVYGEPNALFDPGDNERSLDVGDYHPERQRVLFSLPRIVMSPIEEGEEADNPTSATSSCAKELKANESKFSQGNCLNYEEVEKPSGTISICKPNLLPEIQENGDHIPELLGSDHEEREDIYVCSSTSSDESAALVVEDSEERIGAQDANECQNSGNQRDKCASSDQEADSVEITSLARGLMLSDEFAACVVSDSEEEEPKSPGINAKCDLSSHKGDNTIIFPNQKLANINTNDIIEIVDSAEGRSPMPELKIRRAAKRPRGAMHGEGESPLAKRLQMITID